MYDHVGSLQSIEKSRDVALVTTSEGLELQTKPSEQVANDLGARSLFSLQQVAISNEKINAADYQSQVLDYATEWEQFVTSMIDKELLVVKRLQRNQLHYERKGKNASFQCWW